MLRRVTHTFLLSALILQGLFLWLEQGSLGEFLVQRALSRCEQDIGKIDFDDLQIIGLDTVRLRGLRWLAPRSESLVANAELAEFELSYWNWLLGHGIIHEIHLGSAKIFCPPEYSVSKLNELLVHDLQLHARSHAGRWEIQMLRCFFGDMRIFSIGTIPVDFSSMQPRAEDSDNGLSVLGDLFIVRLKLMALEQAQLSLSGVSEYPAFTLVAKKLNGLSGIHAKDLELSFFLKQGLFLRARNVEAQDLRLAAEDVYGSARINPRHPLLPSAIRMAAKGLAFDKDSLDWLQLQLPGIPQDRTVECKVSALKGESQVEADIVFDLEAQRVAGDFSGLLSEGLLREYCASIWSNYLEGVEFVWADGSAEADLRAPEMFEGSAWVQAYKPQISGERIDYAVAQCAYGREQLLLSHLMGRGGGVRLLGGGNVDFERERARLFLKGYLPPSGLDFLFDDWWPEAWEDFIFPTVSPAVNIDVRLDLADGFDYGVWGEIRGRDFLYTGVPVNSAQMLLYADLQRIELYRMRVHGYGDRLDGNIEWLLAEDNQDALKATIQMRGVIQPSSIAAMQGEGSFAEYLVVSESPEIRFHMHSFLDQARLKGIDSVWGELVFRKPFYFHKARVDSARIPFASTDKMTSFGPVEASFAKGSLNLTLRIDHQQGDVADLVCDLRNAEGQALLEEMSAITSLDADMPKDDPHPLMGQDIGGRLNFHLGMRGHLGRPKSYNGSGHLDITDAKLGKITLFGFLSRLLMIGNFDLEEARGSFTIEEGDVLFPKLSILGPSARMEAYGYYTLGSSNVDMIFRVLPVGTRFIPIISQLNMLLSPITQSFEARLLGPISDAKWSMDVTPFGIGRKKMPMPNKGQ